MANLIAAANLSSEFIFGAGSLGAFGRRCRSVSVVFGCAGAAGSGCCGNGRNGLEFKNESAAELGCCGIGRNGLAVDNALACWGIQLEDDAPVGYCIPGNEPKAVGAVCCDDHGYCVPCG